MISGECRLENASESACSILITRHYHIALGEMVRKTTGIMNQIHFGRLCVVLNARAAFCCALVGVSLLAGCGPAPVKVQGDPTEAATVLDEVLKEWKDGKKTDDLKEEEPPIVARDPDWEAGAVLKSYQVDKSPVAEGGNWRVRATITVDGKNSPGTPQNVMYSVTVIPRVVVLRMDNIE